jgi:hypothetical protein
MLIGIDFGQGAVKVTALSLDGVVLANASEEYTTDHPHPGWSEQNPKDWSRGGGLQRGGSSCGATRRRRQNPKAVHHANGRTKHRPIKAAQRAAQFIDIRAYTKPGISGLEPTSVTMGARE